MPKEAGLETRSRSSLSDRSAGIRPNGSLVAGGRSETWVGTVTNTSANTKTTIAKWMVPAAAEYYDQVSSCASQPYARTLMGAPITYANGVQYPSEPHGAPIVPSPCDAYTKLAPSGAGYLAQAGNAR
jgi:hypothetical protein